ncbi:suppressor protein SRP40 isoform X2 [Lucilia sericata]|uniref:suppressor protein SRP40 isoform X2 n=1 Tax=Lucilia sericata TaxID=13632 RepID=UPI0018A88373|nr:suppressor protein SRP40 isoform X2 [Lucilia sericata]
MIHLIQNPCNKTQLTKPIAMAPTICSGKKRQTRTIATTNIRRSGQGSHQLNQALSNIVNYVSKGSRVSASLRIHSHNETERNNNTTGNYRNTNNAASSNYNHSMETSATLSAASNHRHQQFSFISDNAVTSSTHSDTENSFDLRLANEPFTNDSMATYGSNTTNPTTSTSQSSSSLSDSNTSSTSLSSPSQRETTSSSTSPLYGEERRFQRYSSVMQVNNNIVDKGECSSDNDVTDLYEDDNDKVRTSNKKTNQIHSKNLRKHYYACNEFDSEEEYDELEDARELDNSDMSGNEGSYTDMDTDEGDSMTSLDTEKSAELKRGNHPLLRDKLLAKQQTNNNSSSNTDGLLSIAIKTIKLVKRNQLLQKRLTQLQLETSEFIQSVLANPENRHFRENIKQKVQKVDNV